MHLQFAKMHGLGNDFVVFDSLNQNVQLSTEQIRWIADRRLGVGCDQILVVAESDSNEADFNYQIFNSNGEEVEQCGNGARCIGKFLQLKNLSAKKSIKIKTISGVYDINLCDNGLVSVDMGVAEFEPNKIPFNAEIEATRYTIEVENQKIEIGAVSMGNPHAVLIVDDVKEAPVSNLGPKIEQHSLFPNKVNVGFMQIHDEQNIALRVYERGAGETLACGTGACAAVAVGQSRGLLREKVTVSLPGGDLIIECKDKAQPVMMTGPANLSFEGSLTL